MSHSAEKKPQRGPFGLHYIFEALKFCDLVGESNPRSPATQIPEN